jgi:hypothetical protein
MVLANINIDKFAKDNFIYKIKEICFDIDKEEYFFMLEEIN